MLEYSAIQYPLPATRYLLSRYLLPATRYLLIATRYPLPAAHRWTGTTGSQDKASVLNKHYLRSISIESALGCAGYNAKYWNHYMLPRSRANKITDADSKALIEFFYPDLYAKCDRALAASEGNPMVQSDPISVTNYRFLDNLREITFFWLQDAVIMLDDEAELAGVAPWSTLLGADDEIRGALDRFGEGVKNALHRGDIALHSQLLTQQDLLRSVESSWVSGTDKLASRMSTLPDQVQAITERSQLVARPELLRLFAAEAEESFHRIIRKMLTAGAGKDSNEPASRCNAPAAGEAPEERPSSSAEDEGWVPPSASSSEDGDSLSATQNDSLPATQNDSLPATQNDSLPATQTDSPPATQSTVPPAQHREVARPAWKAPVARACPPGCVQNLSRRKPLPAPDSSVTGPRADGFYLGNDLHTTSEVCKALEELKAWIEENPSKSEFWGVTEGTKQEKEGQSRLRNRRRLLWDEVQYAAEMKDSTVAQVAVKLDEIQKQLGNGISRVEEWAKEARKKNAAPENNGYTIIDEAEAYRKKRLAQMPTGHVA